MPLSPVPRAVVAGHDNQCVVRHFQPIQGFEDLAHAPVHQKDQVSPRSFLAFALSLMASGGGSARALEFGLLGPDLAELFLFFFFPADLAIRLNLQYSFLCCVG